MHTLPREKNSNKILKVYSKSEVYVWKNATPVVTT